MKHFSKILLTTVLTALAATTLTQNVFADGLSVSADKETCETGESFTVTIDATSVGDGTIPPDVQVEFDANRLQFDNCSAEYGGGGGGLVTFKDTKATVDFTTISGGVADVAVTATADDGASPESASVSISVNGDDTAALAAESAATSTNVSAGTVDAGDGRVVQTVFSDEFMPNLFHKETTEYSGQTVECAKFDMGDIVLLYTSDAQNNDGKFMMLNVATGELTDCRMIQGIENRFIIVLNDCEGPIPDGYTKAVLEWDNQTLTAFMENSVADGTSVAQGGVDPADFFLVYAMSSEGNKGWYRYDKNEGTYQRFAVSGEGDVQKDTDEEQEEGSSPAGILDDYIPANVMSIIALVCAPLALILLITVIILAVRYHNLSEDYEAYYEDEDYYGEEEDDEATYDEMTEINTEPNDPFAVDFDMFPPSEQDMADQIQLDADSINADTPPIDPTNEAPLGMDELADIAEPEDNFELPEEEPELPED